MAFPLVEGRLMDVFVYSKEVSEFRTLILIMVGLTVLQIIIRYFADKIENVISQEMILGENKKIIKFLMTCHTNQVIAFEPTYLHSRIIQDTSAIIEFYLESVRNLLNNVLIMVIAAIVLYRVSGYILLSLAIFIIIYSVIYYVFKEKIFVAHKSLMESSNDCFSFRNSFYINFLETKVRRIESELEKRLNTKENTLMMEIKRYFTLNFRMTTLRISSSSLFQFAGFALGGIAVLRGHITLGVFSYIMQYFVMLLSTVDQIFEFGRNYQTYKASISRMDEIFAIQQENDGEIYLNSIDEIQIDELNYKYNKEEPWMYKNNINLTFVPRKVYSISGENGVGKTTLFMLIAGMFRDDNLHGDIKINGNSIHKININHYRKTMVSIMLQNTSTEGLTVREYVSCFSLNAIIEAQLKRKEFRKIFESEQFNIMEIMDKKFSQLSGGEKKLVDLFICLSKDADVYLLDEPTANIFSELREGIIQLLQCISEKGKIVIVITHDKELISQSVPYVLR